MKLSKFSINKYITEYSILIKNLVKKNEKGKIWEINQLRQEINKNVPSYMRLTSRQVGILIPKISLVKTYKNIGRTISYIFVLRRKRWSDENEK